MSLNSERRQNNLDRRSAPPPPKSVAISSDRIQDAIYGFTRSRLLFTAVDLLLFTHIYEGKNTIEQLAPILEADTRALRMFMDGLVGTGFLGKENNVYTLPEDVENYLVQSSANYMGGMVKHGKRLYDNWGLLRDVIRSGMPAGGARALTHIEEYFSELVKGLYVSNFQTAQELASALEIGSENNTDLKILDVAGGSAVWSIVMLEKDPKSRATVLDYPKVIEVAKEYIDSHGLSERYDYIPGDLEMLDFPEAQYDLAILANICHAIGEETAEKLIADVAKSLKLGGRIAIVDFVPDNARSQEGWPLIFGVNMLISTDSGDVFTQEQYKNWFEKAGLSFVATKELESEVTTLIGLRSSL